MQIIGKLILIALYNSHKQVSNAYNRNARIKGSLTLFSAYSRFRWNLENVSEKVLYTTKKKRRIRNFHAHIFLSINSDHVVHINIFKFDLFGEVFKSRCFVVIDSL